MKEKKTYRIDEVAEQFSISERTVRRLIEKGKLSVVYITPDAPRITAESINSLLQQSKMQKY